MINSEDHFLKLFNLFWKTGYESYVEIKLKTKYTK